MPRPFIIRQAHDDSFIEEHNRAKTVS